MIEVAEAVAVVLLAEEEVAAVVADAVVPEAASLVLREEPKS